MTDYYMQISFKTAQVSKGWILDLFWTLKEGTLNGHWNDFYNIAHEIITLSSGPDIRREEGEKT